MKKVHWTYVVTSLAIMAFLVGLTAPNALAKDAWSETDYKALQENMPKKATAKPAKERVVLVLDKCKGFRHSSIPFINKMLEEMGTKTGAWKAVFTSEIKDINAENLKKYDALILNNTTKIDTEMDDAQKKAFLDFIKSGKGIVGIHAATDNFYKTPELAAVMGGLFAGHPWNAGGTWALKIDEPNHPLCKGFDGGFLVKEELYKLKEPYSRENLRVLVSLDMDHGANRPGREDKDNAISYIQKVGDGRMFYCSLGHNNQVMTIPCVLQHYLDGIQYALGDLKCCDEPSAKLKDKPKPALCPKDAKKK